MSDIRLTLWGWIGLSFTAYVVVRMLAWRFRQPRPGKAGQWVERFRSWAGTPFLISFVRVGYFVLLPYLLLLRGVTNSRWMGLSNLDWPRGLGIGIPVALAATALLVVAVSRYQHLTHNGASFPKSDFVVQPWGWATILPGVIFSEVHWAFYRSGTLALGWGRYTGCFASLAIILLEQALDPTVANGVQKPGKSLHALMPGVFALLSTLLFYFTANLWLTIALHWAVEWAILQVVARTAPVREPGGFPFAQTPAGT
ncbi:MAG: hypothetical protein GXP41_01585 [Chloroflexi bacterium]|nr:hypothetical protein [Chloroflexota bacterium]